MRKNRVITVISVVVLTLSIMLVSLPVSAQKVVPEKGYIDNSSLIPAIKPDSEVKLISANGGKLKSPDWVSSLIIEEMNVANASPNGRFSGMNYVLDHVAESGVNGIWLTPIYDGKHYLNYGPGTVDPYLTGTLNYEEGWKVVADFVKEAHKRNIRVFLDIVTWGASEFSEIYANNPTWFGDWSETYKGYLYNWENESLVNWFSNEMIDIVHKTDIDGFRADCGISYCGTKLYEIVRTKLYAEGNYIAIIGETINEQTVSIFDFDEHSVNYDIATQGGNYVDGNANIITASKSGYGLDTTQRQLDGEAGKNTYYSSIVTCHDSQNYLAQGQYVHMAYASILSPFIPMWYIGEEWNNPYNSTGWLWANVINWNKLSENRDYYETIKAYIRIRRMFPEIFTYFPENHRDVNICTVNTDHSNTNTKAYARYFGDKGIMVIPNYDEMNSEFEITIPYSDMGLDVKKTYEVVNLLSGKIIAAGKGSDLVGIKSVISNGNVAAYIVLPASDEGLKIIQKKADNATDNITSSLSSFDDIMTYSEDEDVLTSDDETSDDTDSEDVSKVKNKAKKKASVDKKDEDTDYLLYVWIILGVVVIGGITAAAILLIKKKR